MLKLWSDFFCGVRIHCVCVIIFILLDVLPLSANNSADLNSISSGLVSGILSDSRGGILSRAGGGPQSGAGPETDIIAAVLYLTGATSAEELSEEEVEHWRDLADVPLEINRASRSSLESSGLLSVYQVASFLEYRARCGDVMSFAELAAVNGFGKEFTEALKPFISLKSLTSVADYNSASGRRPRNSLIINESNKLSIPRQGDDVIGQYSWNVKYSVKSQSRYAAGLSLKNNWASSRWTPSTASFYAALGGRGHLSALVIGDYALHFGQGLALWTGFSMSSVQSVISFWKRSTGIRPSQSLSSTTTMRGLAAEFEFGKLSVSAFSAFPGVRPWMENGSGFAPEILPGLNVAWHSRNGAVSFTLYGTFDKLENIEDGTNGFRLGDDWGMSASKTSVDMRYCWRGVEVFGEAALDICAVKTAMNGGVMVPLDDNWKLAVYGRWIPSGYDMTHCAPVRAWSGKTGESGVATGLTFRSLQFTADYAHLSDSEKRQVKVQLTYPWQISENMTISLNVRERWRNYGLSNRVDFRSDAKFLYGDWQTVLRLAPVLTDKFAGLVYVDEGYFGRIGAVFIRSTFFWADKWDDRIYCYERDAPGNFNVPAYYGRGYALSLVSRLSLDIVGTGENRFGRSVVKMWLRAGFSDTPWSLSSSGVPKPSKLEIKFQLSYNF